jgi:F0F1-type ATP synthase membrane subunit b/b'
MQQKVPESNAKVAIDRVLEAERASADANAEASRQAEGIIEAAREKRRRILDTARRRASRMHEHATRRLQTSMAELEAGWQRPVIDDSVAGAALDDAVERLAGRLTGGS